MCDCFKRIKPVYSNTIALAETMPQSSNPETAKNNCQIMTKHMKTT